MCWVRLEEFNYHPGMEPPLLFSFFSKEQGGFEIFFDENILMYRILEPGEYTPPTTEGAIPLCDIENNEWTLIYFSHKKDLISSKVKVFINWEQVFEQGVDYPKIDKLKHLNHAYLFKNMTA